MSSYVKVAGRAFVLLFLVAMFFLAAGNTTPAYATPLPEVWPVPYGDYVLGYVKDYSFTLSPYVQIYSDGNAVPYAPGPVQPLPAAVSGSAVIGDLLPGGTGNGAGSTANVNIQTNNWNAFCVAYNESAPALSLTASVLATAWDTIYPIYPLGPPAPGLGTVTLSGDYINTGDTGGSVELYAFSYVPSADPSGYSEISSQPAFFPPADSRGVFSVTAYFPTDAVTVGIEAYTLDQAHADPSYPISGVFFDPAFYVTLPDGGIYTSASGVEYPEAPAGAAIPEPATLSLLGLGLAGLVAKLSGRRNR